VQHKLHISTTGLLSKDNCRLWGLGDSDGDDCSLSTVIEIRPELRSEFLLSSALICLQSAFGAKFSIMITIHPIHVAIANVAKFSTMITIHPIRVAIGSVPYLQVCLLLPLLPKFSHMIMNTIHPINVGIGMEEVGTIKTLFQVEFHYVM
jgi:hypothetical protein